MSNTVSFRVNDAQFDEMLAYCERHDITVSDLCRQAVKWTLLLGWGDKR